MSPCIQALYSYPVKSCAGLRHEALRITEAGPDQDRHWVLTDAQGTFMTQRQFPRMVLIRPEPVSGGLWLRTDGQDDCFVSLPPADAPAVPVTIFGTDTLGADQGEEAARWLSAFLGTPCRLLHLHPRAHRPASPLHVVRWLNRHPEQRAAFSPPGQHQFAYADAFPFLVINQRSLRAFPEGVLFGMDAIAALPQHDAWLRVGDPVEPQYDFE